MNKSPRMVHSKSYYIFLCFLIALHTSLSDVSTSHLCLPAPSQKCFTAIDGTEQKLTWNNAEKFCEKNFSNGRLASIHNAFDIAIITSWLSYFTTDPWIGAIQIGSLPFQWTDGSPWDYSNWAPGQPTGPCAQVCYSSATNAGIQCQQGKWRTADCETTVAQFICEYGNITSPPPTVVQRSCDSNNGGGKCLSLVIGSLEWSEAEKFCSSQVQNGSVFTLASITSQLDENIIETFLQYPTLGSNFWIGGFALHGGPFSWTDGSPVAFTNWAPGQPPAQADGCLQVCLKNDSPCVQGKWTVAPCTTKQSFICEQLVQHATGEDCLDLHKKYDFLSSGIYSLTPPGVPSFEAYCEMDIDGGGWTVFQRRVDSGLSFYDKKWNEYKNGFNNGLNNNLWLGNDKIHVLSTKDANVELRMDIWRDRAPDASNPNVYLYGKYTSFSIDNEANYYTLHFSSSSTGNASTGDPHQSIDYNNGMKFSTIDVSHDNYHLLNCSGKFELGGWWLDACTSVSLNGKYVPPDWHFAHGFSWCVEYRSTCYNPAQSRMMLRKLEHY